MAGFPNEQTQAARDGLRAATFVAATVVWSVGDLLLMGRAYDPSEDEAYLAVTPRAAPAA